MPTIPIVILPLIIIIIIIKIILIKRRRRTRRRKRIAVIRIKIAKVRLRIKIVKSRVRFGGRTGSLSSIVITTNDDAAGEIKYDGDGDANGEVSVIDGGDNDTGNNLATIDEIVC